MPEFEGVIELRAANPHGDLACDLTIATDVARSGFRDDLARGIVYPIRQLDDGIELTFTGESWGAVMRYVDMESRCCSFLNLAARRLGDAVILAVTGRPEARAFINNIFMDAGQSATGQNTA